MSFLSIEPEFRPEFSRWWAVEPTKLRDYLDGAIRQWRKRVDETTDEDVLIARCYVDAFQSVRISVFGEALP